MKAISILLLLLLLGNCQTPNHDTHKNKDSKRSPLDLPDLKTKSYLFTDSIQISKTGTYKYNGTDISLDSLTTVIQVLAQKKKPIILVLTKGSPSEIVLPVLSLATKYHTQTIIQEKD